MQTTSRVLMIRPMHFVFNTETAINNSFQTKGDQQQVTGQALQEFDEFVTRLRAAGIEVTVVEDSASPHTPDAIFPNNWISFHKEGVYCLYPMFAVNRRQERKPEVLKIVTGHFHFNKLIDFSAYENKGQFLEGTGSMVLDRENKISYACLSPRTNPAVLDDFCRRMNYRPVIFNAVDENGLAIYHTNVMMCVADRFVVICLDCIPDADEKKRVEDSILSSRKEIISISLPQMNQFAGNMLQLENDKAEKILVMSDAAWFSLTDGQKEKLSGYNRILHASLKSIESNGGGSARCMIAEIHI